MSHDFKIGDHVAWNSEAGRVSGRIIAVHTRDFDYKGHTHHAAPDAPQYEIKSTRPTMSQPTRAPRSTSYPTEHGDPSAADR